MAANIASCETRVQSSITFLVRGRSNNPPPKNTKTRLTLSPRPSSTTELQTIHINNKSHANRGRYLQNSASPGSVGQADSDVSVEPPGSSERGVQHLGPVRSCHNKHAPSLNVRVGGSSGSVPVRLCQVPGVRQVFAHIENRSNSEERRGERGGG